jgi:molybdopterin-guanine dinucleotide biosynthesis protein A
VTPNPSGAVEQQPVGVVLAGGLGRRLGGAKATVNLCGRPLICYPLEALAAVLSEVAIIAKADTALPSLPGVTVWIEPQTPRHPLAGIVEALGLADGRPVLACASDFPFVTPEVVTLLARADPGGAPAVLAAHAGELQPLFGCYQPAAAPLLAGAAAQGTPARAAVAAIGPRLLQVDDPDVLFNVNAPEDLLHAAAMLDRRRPYPNVKS